MLFAVSVSDFRLTGRRLTKFGPLNRYNMGIGIPDLSTVHSVTMTRPDNTRNLCICKARRKLARLLEFLRRAPSMKLIN